MEIKFISMVLLLFFVRALKAAKINQISVPSYYLLDGKVEPLILDCDFSVDSKETGFVLKWLHNSVPIYQWIPQRPPFALGPYRGRLDLDYSASNETFRKYSALSITNPSIADTGNFTCNVQTFSSSDKKSAQMIVVQPETSMNFKYNIEEANQIVNLECSIFNINPVPEVTFLFNEEEKSITIDVDAKEANSLFNVTVTAKISQNDISDDSRVTCWMRINDTEYEKKERIIYDDPKQTSTTKNTLDGESMFASELNDANSGVMSSKVRLGTFIIILLNLMFAQRFLES